MGQPRPLLSFIFGLFKHTSWQFLQQIYVINVHPVYSAGIQPLKHDSPPITTRPGLPFRFVINIFHDRVVSLLGYLAPPSDPSHWLKDGDCLNQLKAKSEPRPVWQDLAIFESHRWRTLLQKLPKYIKVFLGFFENINFQVTIAVATFGATLEKIWRLFISASGHTGAHSVLPPQEQTFWNPFKRKRKKFLLCTRLVMPLLFLF